MLNEEKAIEIANKMYPVRLADNTNGVEYDVNESDRETFIEGAIQMAIFKDSQFKEYLKKKKEEIQYKMTSPLYDECALNDEQKHHDAFIKKEFLCELINELF